MADFSKPVTTDTYANVLTYLKATTSDLSLGLDPATTTPTNLPTNSIRWSSAANKWQKWNGTTWGDLSSLYSISISGNAATATTLATARNINGVSFNGSADITVTANTPNALTLSNAGSGAASGLTFDGSTARTISYNSIGALPAASPTYSGTLTGGTGAIAIGTSHFVKDANGRIGIGLTTPFSWGASVSSASIDFGGGYSMSSSPTGGMEVYVNAYHNGTNLVYKANGPAAVYSFDTNGGATWSNAPLGAAGATVTTSQKLGLDANGNLVAAGTIKGSNGVLFADGSALTSATFALVNSKTAVSPPSGTTIDFTAIPAGTKRITVMLYGVSTNGANNLQIQLGTGSTPTYVTTGYYGGMTYGNNAVVTAAMSTGMDFAYMGAASASVVGQVVLTNLASNIWVASGMMQHAETTLYTMSSGGINLAAALTALRITAGGNTFDAGSVNILYE